MSEDFGKNGIPVSSRIRLARNISTIPFPYKASEEQALKAANCVIEAASSNKLLKTEKFGTIYLDTINPVSRLSLVERHLISPELGAGKKSGTVINKNETISIMLNEEDHVRIQCILPGFSLTKAYNEASKIDDALQEKIKFAYSDKYGFLTSCPSNLGTGMRAGVMLHLPALVIGSKLGNIAHIANKFGLAIRGIYGEGSEALGDLFQISNQNSLGLSEKEIVDNIHAISKEIIKLECEERNNMLITKEDSITDKIMRAYGILTNAYMLATKEAMSLLSLLRMGADMGVYKGSDKSIYDLMIDIQPATLSLRIDKNSTDRNRDIERARYLKQQLADSNK